MNLEEICYKVCEISKSVGKYILNKRQNFNYSHVEIKGLNSLVSYVDKRAEEKIVSALQEIIPEAGFITEEETIQKEHSEWNWIIDPLDGTTNFIHNIPTYAVSIALAKGDIKNNAEIVLGVVYEVNREECYYAYEGKAFLNNAAIRVKENSLLSNALVATGFPYYDFSRNDEYIQALMHLFKTTQGIRRIGTAATDLVYVASGRFDAYFEFGLNPWDVAAGAYIVECAGGKTTDFDGSNNWLFGKEIIASSSSIFTNFKSTLDLFLKK